MFFVPNFDRLSDQVKKKMLKRIKTFSSVMVFGSGQPRNCSNNITILRDILNIRASRWGTESVLRVTGASR